MLRAIGLVLMILLVGCGEPDPEPRRSRKRPTTSGRKVDDDKKVNVGQNVWLNVLPDGRRQVIVSAEVVLIQADQILLELFLTRKNGKEHEAILAADVDARQVHNALLLAGATAGEPARWPVFMKEGKEEYRFIPASGTPIEVEVTYTLEGKERTVRAQELIRNTKTKKELELGWVFGGSILYGDPDNPNAPKRYAANDGGDLIAVVNLGTAMLDVPVESQKAQENRSYEPWTERLPPKGTKVVVTLTPILPKKK